LVSRVVLAADGGSEYSHVGLISLVGGKIWVLHAVPPEEPAQQGGVVAEPLSTFLEPDKATAAGLYRSRDPRAALAAERAAWRFVRAHIPFDPSFDLSTPGELYCTEMVWRAYREAGVDLAPPIPGRNEKYLLPSRLLRSPNLRRIQELSEEGAKP
ncbi:MAG TPA: YiiX/YebB-like N1pC/P60 family cysteine hydrolase, partial [Thermoanaerobaculia bacterium]